MGGLVYNGMGEIFNSRTGYWEFSPYYEIDIQYRERTRRILQNEQKREAQHFQIINQDFPDLPEPIKKEPIRVTSLDRLDEKLEKRLKKGREAISAMI